MSAGERRWSSTGRTLRGGEGGECAMSAACACASAKEPIYHGVAIRPRRVRRRQTNTCRTDRGRQRRLRYSPCVSRAETSIVGVARGRSAVAHRGAGHTDAARRRHVCRRRRHARHPFRRLASCNAGSTIVPAERGGTRLKACAVAGLAQPGRGAGAAAIAAAMKWQTGSQGSGMWVMSGGEWM